MKKPYNSDDDENLFDKLMDQFCLMMRRLSSRHKKLCEQLFALAWTQDKRVSNSTKKEILKHLRNEDICNDEWFQIGKHLLLKAREEKSK